MTSALHLPIYAYHKIKLCLMVKIFKSIKKLKSPISHMSNPKANLAKLEDSKPKGTGEEQT